MLPIGGGSATRLHRDWLFDRLGRPADGVAEELTSRGFNFTIHLDDFAPTLRSAAQLLTLAPSLERAVESAVRKIILLDAPAGYDISHSEPRWPETIFVSAPPQGRQVAGLRALENIVHEAMHLQLTTFERIAPLVADETTMMASPWRTEPRHLQGVLHGSYVFRCISTFFGLRPLLDSLDAEGTTYVVRRTQEIEEEMRAVDLKKLARGLTLKGRAFLDELF